MLFPNDRMSKSNFIQAGKAIQMMKNKVLIKTIAVIILLLPVSALADGGIDVGGRHSTSMVFIKGGCFDMGDQFGDGEDNEKPVHEVCVDDFYLGEHEVTQKEWKDVMGSNPSHFNYCCGDFPVETVSWNDVQQYIRKLNDKTGMRYRLPTEAEWEYAAREGGRLVRFGTGKDTIGPDEANIPTSSNPRSKEPYVRSGVYRKKTVPVKSFPPNSLGLYDMSGNVWEWVQDWYDEDYYRNSPKNNPTGPESGEYRVLRGGSWYILPFDMRAAFRYWGRRGIREVTFGFRVAQDKFQVIDELKTMASDISKSEEERKIAERKKTGDERGRAEKKDRQFEEKQRLAQDRERKKIKEKKPKGMVFIKGGCYHMGDSFGDGNGDETPVHEVCVDDYYLGEHEVTVGEFREFVNETSYRTDSENIDGCYYWTGFEWKKDRKKYWDDPGFPQTDKNPVTCVSWNDTNEFMKWRKRKTNFDYRLPTEAEWEYAAREGGRMVRFSTGKNTIGPNDANFDASSKFEKPYSRSGVSKDNPVAVKSYPPNSLGLYDMSGNLWEWVSDWYDNDYYSNSPKNNPKGPSSGSIRVGRGGSWDNEPWYVRTTYRGGFDPSCWKLHMGFRLALGLSDRTP